MRCVQNTVGRGYPKGCPRCRTDRWEAREPWGGGPRPLNAALDRVWGSACVVLLVVWKRKFLSLTDRETVGGPIDVAVITKGDGFVWVKRKHYFSPEYNPRVIARYQQGG